MDDASDFRIRPVRADDADFVLALVPRFVAFELPSWRDREETAAGIRRKFEQHVSLGFGIPSFITTLGMLFMLRSLCVVLYSKGAAPSLPDDAPLLGNSK